MRKHLIGAAVTVLMSQCLMAQDQPAQSIESLKGLLGEWKLSVVYANGNKGEGTRVCQMDLGGSYVRCDSNITFGDDDKTTRASVNYYSYNRQAGIFEEVVMWQFPLAKKIAQLTLNQTERTFKGDAEILSGQRGEATRRFYDSWTYGPGKIEIKINTGPKGAAVEDLQNFITETMTK